MNLLEWLWSWIMSKKSKRPVTVGLTDEEYKRYDKVAKTQGSSVPKLIAYTMSQLYPADMKFDQPAAGPTKSIDLPSAKSVMGVTDIGVPDDAALALEDALYASASAQDQRDQVELGAPLPPRREAPSIPRGPITTPAPLVENPHGVHSCAHHSPTLPANLTWNDCQGTCLSSRQRGRPCQWPAQVASGCTYYRARRALPLAG